MRLILILSFLILPYGASAFGVDDLSGVKEKISKTIVRVKSGNKYSTGFFYKNGKQIVTTMHSIGDPDDIEVYIEEKAQWCRVSLDRVNKNADLVLLGLMGCQSQFFIPESNPERPVVDDKVFTLGYYLNNDKWIDRDFTIGMMGGTKLKDLLTASAKQEIKSLGFPSLNTEILYLKGQLLHGFSGSPIVSPTGKLIGISSGGLENGAVGISWCINFNELKTLESSNDQFPRESLKAANVLFAFEDSDEPPVSLTNGTFTLEKTRTRTFEQLNQTANYEQYPEMGLYQVLEALDQRGIDYENFKFDIYVETHTGATIVLPAGYKIRVEGDLFYAYNSDETISGVVHLENTSNLQGASERFEQRLITLTNIYTWQPDTRASYMTPFIRSDQTVINRKAWYNYQPNRYIFEVVAGRNQTFFGFAIMLEDRFDFNSFEFFDHNEAATILLATQLVTFSY